MIFDDAVMEPSIEKSCYYDKSRYNGGFSAIVFTRFYCTDT